MEPNASAPAGDDDDVVGPTAGAAVRETHSAVVFFMGDLAVKVKKPVDLGFLDFSDPGTRGAVCEREVELNRRLAPDVYIGVGTVELPTAGLAEPMVVMRRLPESKSLSRLSRSGAPLGHRLDELARTVAAFHARADRSGAIDAAATSEAVVDQWEVNARVMEEWRHRVFPSGSLDRVAALVRRYHAGRHALFDRRIREGRICDGHGDLLADDIFCLDDGPRVLDCVEFDDRLRRVDVLSDVATLAMDLEASGRPDLAQGWLDAYRRASGDEWPSSLAHHYIAYRAQVRALVAAVRHGQGDENAAATARSLTDVCLRHLERARVRLVLVGGLPGTGKSTLALSLARHLGATVIRSDEVRRQLLGPDAFAGGHPDGFDLGRYAPSATDATYDSMIASARARLRMGETVVLDATFRRQADREAARALARTTSSDLEEFRCVAPRALAERRLSLRLAEGHDPSEATAAVARRMEATFDPWPTASEVDTGSADVSGDAGTVVQALGSPGAP